MLSFRQIEIFRAIMITKSVNGAARMLNSAQPGLSRALKHMESKLGFKLFHRFSGRLVPTSEAIQLFEDVQLLYKDVERIHQVVRRLEAGEDNIFRLGAPPSLGHSMVPLVLRKLKQRFKNLSMHFDILPIEQVTDYLLFQRGEYALTVYEVDHPSILSEWVGQGRMVCVLDPGHRLAARKMISLGDIAADHVISFQQDTPHAQIIRDMFARAGVELRISTYVRFAETAMALVQQELGVAIVDEFTAMQAGYPNVRVVALAEEAIIPVYINRGRFTPRSAVGDAFDKTTRKVFAR